ncbi:hypothetical protein [uncultured Roseovarius sp.]|uniref:hypothetical protein n=1 Tax=uncultured Roseovarius sp. TaxID=293344 RepID=UPI00260E4CF4|nr:hypothetical protein [uncultured Roseovarius sp.]
MSRLITRLQKLEAQVPVAGEQITVIHHLVEKTDEGPRVYGALSPAGTFARDDRESEEEFKLRVAEETTAFVELGE